MAKSVEKKSVEELKAKAYKLDKKCGICAISMYSAMVLFGLSLFIGLPLGLIFKIPALSIASGILAGVGVAGQISGMTLAYKINSKLMDTEEEIKDIENSSIDYSVSNENVANKEVNVQKTVRKNKSVNKTKSNDDTIELN